MRAVVQRVTDASVTVDGQVVGALDRPGLAVFVGVTHTDTPDVARALAAKVAGLRILRGERSALDDAAPVLVVSQFTLYADTRRGRRPSWSAAAISGRMILVSRGCRARSTQCLTVRACARPRARPMSVGSSG